MAKGAYIGVDGIAKKIKKGYIGVDGVARRIKKAYIGIGGVARPCWGGEELVYYGITTGLSAARQGLAATTIGNYVLFGGGYDGTYLSTVDAYNTYLTRTIPTALNVARYNLAATTIGNYALFGGGCGIKDASEEDDIEVGVLYTVDAYDTSLTRTTPTRLSAARQGLAATTIGNYALFGGGVTKGAWISSNIVDAYDTSLTRTTPTALSAGVTFLAATTIGNYALFGGGRPKTGVVSATVDAYDTSLTRTTPTALSAARQGLAATTIGNYALFGGGYDGTYLSTVDAYTIS